VKVELAPVLFFFSLVANAKGKVLFFFFLLVFHSETTISFFFSIDGGEQNEGSFPSFSLSHRRKYVKSFPSLSSLSSSCVTFFSMGCRVPFHFFPPVLFKPFSLFIPLFFSPLSLLCGRDEAQRVPPPFFFQINLSLHPFLLFSHISISVCLRLSFFFFFLRMFYQRKVSRHPFYLFSPPLPPPSGNGIPSRTPFFPFRGIREASSSSPFPFE